ncbi:hypothetical protein F1737_10230 [Methanoplanus sp. FWC-SCC4]|uniref:Methyltransferase n=1 Tax=Methanochimaera problematica TaxID=2609417 RepID=A0AA97FEF0_9EURY|nr:hypothetical protein [Methanoplanus sp. FWC-SCC4]WOF17027.1 hypothetical protein F1737_10230 [Methanoplanus sp. FWC-SCC4]
MSDLLSKGMTCPVCGGNCIKDSAEIINSLETIFLPCKSCGEKIRDKRKPPSEDFSMPCPSCGKRFIDDVLCHCYFIMAEERDISPDMPLMSVGMPLVNPGFAMRRPPHLPAKSLVLLSKYVSLKSAKRIVDEVPEVGGVLKDENMVPGISCGEEGFSFHKNRLLAGCDVRCDVFHAGRQPFLIYKEQSAMHIEFPRGFDPKIMSVRSNIHKYLPDIFVDACSGAGTLGISAALFGVNSVVFNDLWYAAAFWSSVNLFSNRTLLGISEFRLLSDYSSLKENPAGEKIITVACAKSPYGEFKVYQGDLKNLAPYIPKGETLTALDFFEKKNTEFISGAISKWKTNTGGHAFIP